MVMQVKCLSRGSGGIFFFSSSFLSCSIFLSVCDLPLFFFFPGSPGDLFWLGGDSRGNSGDLFWLGGHGNFVLVLGRRFEWSISGGSFLVR